ncbi:hypothetical protein ACHAW5_004377 [Stephanodiscus triporus]|uniref:Uncharacterized protein n=1 Tax=Stephanodiscus triporus TaxID=2934178 RepID=A0ABD3QLZ6_9STRA
MDGFHYSREQMKAIGSSSDAGYTYDELLARRGTPWTFDTEGYVAAFTRARQTGKTSLPVYCRTRSDPVPDGVRLHRGTKIVLLEDNSLLAWDDERGCRCERMGCSTRRGASLVSRWSTESAGEAPPGNVVGREDEDVRRGGTGGGGEGRLE